MPTKLEFKNQLISVLMGIYYRRDNTRLLQRSIQSILSQTYSDIELLICDDGSTDQAKRTVDSFAKADERIRLVRKGGLVSLPSKLNACLECAKGLLVARMDDDDFARSDRFQKQASYLEQHPEVSFVGSNIRLVRDDIVVGTRQLPECPEIRDFLFVQPYIHSALLFYKEALLAVNGYSEDKNCLKCEDYDLLLRMYEHGYCGANLQECLLDYTIPNTAKGNRTMGDRWNEAVTRYRRFHSLGLLPKAWPYVVKPLAVGMLPASVLAKMKNKTS